MGRLTRRRASTVRVFGDGLIFGAVCLLLQYNSTPLHYAAYDGHARVVELLLDNGGSAAAVDKVRIALGITVGRPPRTRVPRRGRCCRC